MAAAVCLAWGSRVAHADDDTDVLKFREPVVIQHGQDVTTAVSVGSYVQIDGTVRENAVSIGGDVILGPTGVIEGDAVAVGGKVVQAPGSHISGKVTATGSSLAHVRRALASALPALFVGLGVLAGKRRWSWAIPGDRRWRCRRRGLALFISDQTRFAQAQIETSSLAHARRGGAGDFFVDSHSCFSGLNGVGDSSGLCRCGAILVAARSCLGTVALGQWVGIRLARQFRRPLPAILSGLLGLLILTVFCSLPVVGFFVQILIVCMALGAVTFSRFRTM